VDCKYTNRDMNPQNNYLTLFNQTSDYLLTVGR
jgi:hypothetical protein